MKNHLICSVDKDDEVYFNNKHDRPSGQHKNFVLTASMGLILDGSSEFVAHVCEEKRVNFYQIKLSFFLYRCAPPSELQLQAI